MLAARPKLLLACNQQIRNSYLPPDEVARLEAFADWTWFPCEGGGIESANPDPAVAAALRGQLADIDGLIICHGAPTITEAVLAGAPRLRIIGELEGDRFASRFDLEAAWARAIRTVDTTNGSSYPVAEWALGLILVALRNAGSLFRQMIAGNTQRNRAEMMKARGLLTGSRSG